MNGQDQTSTPGLGSVDGADASPGAGAVDFVDDARRELLELAHTAAGIGTFDWDLTSGALRWDDRLLEVFGLSPEDFGQTIEAFNAAVHPEDLPRVSALVAQAIDSCGEFAAEYRITRPGGQVGWVGARGRVLCAEDGTAVRMLGAAWDVTVHRVGEARVQQVLESMSTAFFSLDTDWRFTYVNARAEALLGASRQDLLGRVVWEAFPAAVGSDFETHYRHTMGTGETVSFDAYYPPPLDSWYEVRASRNLEGLAVYFTDITERRAAHAAAEQAADRAALLARVAAHLAEAPDVHSALAGLPRLLIPALGEWCIATYLDTGSDTAASRDTDADGQGVEVRDVGSWHADPALRAVTDDYRGQRERSPAFRAAAVQAMRPRDPVVLQSAAAATSSLLLDAPALRLQERLAPEAMVAVQLRGRGPVLGFLTVCNSAARGPFASAEVATLTELANQVGLALDNTRLHAAARDLSTELQRSLLTELPQPDHLQIAVRYVPAAAGNAVGGDWYDAFATRDGATCLVIGDVAGHDRGAAVAMAQVRNILRGIAYAVAEPPAAVLTLLDRGLDDLGVAALTTAILAKVEQGTDDASRGRRTLRWSNAGHPPPLLLHPDGRAEFLSRTPDLLLGLGAGAERHDHTHTLAPGVTVVLFTDGLVERRGEDLDVGLQRLHAAVRRHRLLDPEALCDALVVELATGAEDDVAVMALRAHPEDAPRPDRALVATPMVPPRPTHQPEDR